MLTIIVMHIIWIHTCRFVVMLHMCCYVVVVVFLFVFLILVLTGICGIVVIMHNFVLIASTVFHIQKLAIQCNFYLFCITTVDNSSSNVFDCYFIIPVDNS